jgi:hypothetical protein
MQQGKRRRTPGTCSKKTARGWSDLPNEENHPLPTGNNNFPATKSE